MDLKFHETRYEIVKRFAVEISKIYRGDDLQKRLVIESCKGKLFTLMALLIAEKFLIKILADIIRQAMYVRDQNLEGEDELTLMGMNVEDDLRKFADGLVKTHIDNILSGIPERGYFYERQVNAFFDDLYENMRALKNFYSNYKNPYED